MELRILLTMENTYHYKKGKPANIKLERIGIYQELGKGIPELAQRGDICFYQ